MPQESVLTGRARSPSPTGDPDLSPATAPGMAPTLQLGWERASVNGLQKRDWKLPPQPCQVSGEPGESAGGSASPTSH